MGIRVDNTRFMLAHARKLFANNVQTLSMREALFSAGGYRSIVGVLKHMGGWVHVYRSSAFDDAPQHWDRISWPRGPRDTIEKTPAYLHEVIAWVDRGLEDWDDTLAGIEDDDLDRLRPLHWGHRAPLSEITVAVAHEVMYHTGEVNMLLSIARSEAWEYTEEVEENHIDTYGHGVRPEWMTDEQAERHQQAMRIAHQMRSGIS